jgi:hypothetical protein
MGSGENEMNNQMTSSPQTRSEIAQLRALIEKLTTRIEALEAEQRKQRKAEVEENA